jgi:hypothetical protein
MDVPLQSWRRSLCSRFSKMIFESSFLDIRVWVDPSVTCTPASMESSSPLILVFARVLCHCGVDP